MAMRETISVKLFGGLEERCGRQREAAISAATATTLAALIAALGLSPAAVGLVLVNGLHASPDSPVAAGDEVSLFPPVGGG
jgi:molybdopterin synthase sulfur carrier subunit